jgi:hypothetical protein
MKPEQLEIARLKREVAKLKAERDIQKNRGLLRVGFIAKCDPNRVQAIAK